MEPRLFSHGNADYVLVVQLDEVRASMEPRLFSHGNREQERCHEQVIRASMEPRLFSHGNNCVPRCGAENDVWLQWSHDFSVMETISTLC